MKTNHNRFLDLAFNIAQINLGKTKKNPSVGCVIVKKNSVINRKSIVPGIGNVPVIGNLFKGKSL